MLIQTELQPLLDWLAKAVNSLDTEQAQIVLNFDREVVDWEIKTVTTSEANNQRERLERRRSGRVRIRRKP